MSEEIKEAVRYAASTNELENNGLSNLEIEKVIENILSNNSDKSFLSAVVELVTGEKFDDEIVEKEHGKIR